MQITTITLALPLRMGTVNCYLIKTEGGFVMIDTGTPGKRAQLENELNRAGCKPGDLELVLITHGDFDHIGNAAYLRRNYGAKIAMHAKDAGMAERGDMFWNRKKGSALLRRFVPILLRFGKSNQFTPDVTLEDGDNLSDYGLDAHILALPGHSQGSIGILTGDGDLFCGDLLDNTKKPGSNAIMDDPTAANASIEKLKCRVISMVYPGHGSPFPIEQFFIIPVTS